MKKVTKSVGLLWWFCIGGYFGLSITLSIIIGAFARNGVDLGGIKSLLAIGGLVAHYHAFKKFATSKKEE